MIQDTVLFLGTGMILKFVFRKFKTMTGYGNTDFLNQLFDCGLCLGFWVYFGLSWVTHFSLFDSGLVGSFLTGVVSSFVVWVWTAGWDTLFRNIVLE